MLVASTSAVRSVRTGGGNKEPRRSGAAKWEETPSQRDLHSLAESSRCVQLDFAFSPLNPKARAIPLGRAAEGERSLGLRCMFLFYSLAQSGCCAN